MERHGENSSIGKNTRQRTSDRMDYITKLPFTVLLHILSFLPFQDWIEMSRTSREWQYLWTYAQCLNFDELQKTNNVLKICAQSPRHAAVIAQHHNLNQLLYATRMRFMEYVDYIFHHHSGCIINRLRLSLLDAPVKFASRIDRWVRFALTRNIEELELNFFQQRVIRFSGRPPTYVIQNHTTYQVPSGAFAPKLLKKFKLIACKFRSSAFEAFASLRMMCLSRVHIQDVSIGDILSISPLLEDLRLIRCSLSEKYLICKQQLSIKKLSLKHCTESNNNRMIPININAPNLSLLLLEGNYLMESTVMNAAQVVDVIISIDRRIADSASGGILGSLLRDLRHCRSLCLTSWCIQVLPTGEILRESLRIPLYNIEHLRLKVGLIKQELPGISCLLRSCPNLHSLTLDLVLWNIDLNIHWDMFQDMMPDFYNFPEQMYWETQTAPYQCLETSLKKITINGFIGKQNEMCLVEFLLKNAAVLEILELNYFRTDVYGQLTLHEHSLFIKSLYNMINYLIHWPRASTKVKIFVPNLDRSMVYGIHPP